GDFLGHLYRFADVDGQTVTDELNVNFEFTESGSTPHLANSRGTVYLTRERQLYVLNNDGSVNYLMPGFFQFVGGGLVANPITHHLYSNSNLDPSRNFVDINLDNNTYATFGGN